VALALENYVNRGTGATTVGLGRLAADLALSRRSVERGMRELAERGHVSRIAGHGVHGLGGTTSSTKLLAKAPTTVVDTLNEKVPTQISESTDHGGRIPPGPVGRTNPSLPNEPSRARVRVPEAKAARGAPNTSPRQGELPMLGDVARAEPEHVAKCLARIRARFAATRTDETAEPERGTIAADRETGAEDHEPIRPPAMRGEET
jgi:DNA-binding transcriptional MocR family regulator